MRILDPTDKITEPLEALKDLLDESSARKAERAFRLGAELASARHLAQSWQEVGLEVLPDDARCVSAFLDEMGVPNAIEKIGDKVVIVIRPGRRT